MTYSELLLNPITQHYADFSGRSSRLQYWSFNLTASAILYGIMFAGNFLEVSQLAAALAYFLFYAVSFIPSIAILVRRLHDTERSGWWSLFVLIPIFGAIVMFIFCLLPSQKTANKYGPVPSNVVSSEFPVPTAPSPTAQAPIPPRPTDIETGV